MREAILALVTVVLVWVTALAGCKGEKPGQKQDDVNTPKAGTSWESTQVSLTPKTPNSGRRLNWSPYGKRHKLTTAENGLETEIHLGPNGLGPISARLEKSSGSENYDILKVDGNRNGSFDFPVFCQSKKIRCRRTDSARRDCYWIGIVG